MPLYNYEFKELMMEKINKHHESQKEKIITVILPQIEDTGVVSPAKRIEDARIRNGSS